MKSLAVAALVLAMAAPAHASPRLSKAEARGFALAFISPFVDLLDVEHPVATHMDPARRCMRLSSRFVTCRFTATLRTGRTVQSRVRVQRQRDGLLGFWTSLDVLKDGIPAS